MTTPSASTTSHPERHRYPVRNLLAASAGNAVEWFDWTIFGLFSTIFATQFFPQDNPTLAFLNTALTFAIAFFFRPLGGWLLGRIADRRGRKPAMLITVLLMCGGSLLIALTPSFETIGWAAPLLLIIARAAQGISTGGEVGNVYAYLYELAPATHKGRYASFSYVSTGSAILLASVLGYVITKNVDPEALAAWGWRVPFAVGALLGVVVLWLRRSMDESEAFRDDLAERDERGEHEGSPLLATLRHYPRSVLQIIGAVGATTLLYYTLTNALKTYVTTPAAQGGVGAAESDAFLALSIGLVVFIALLYPMGALADRIGRRNVALLSIGSFIVITIPLSLLVTTSLITLTLAWIIGFAAFSGVAAIMPALLSDLMPLRLRGVGVGAWYNVSIALFGGTAPLVVTALAAAGLGPWFFGYCVMMAIVGTIVLLTVPDERKRAVVADTAPPAVVR